MVRPSLNSSRHQVRSNVFLYLFCISSHLGSALESSSRSPNVVTLESKSSLNDQAVKHDDENGDMTIMMTSPSMAARLVFESFTNMIPNPFSWSPRLGSAVQDGKEAVATTAAALCMIPESQTSSTVISDGSVDEAFVREVLEAKEVKKGYVPKERQLEKLRLRMQAEKGQQLGLSAEMSCKRCREGVIRF